MGDAVVPGVADFPDGERIERQPESPSDLRRQHHTSASETDDNGVRAPRRALNKLRARLSRFYYADAVQKPTAQEVEEAHKHADNADEIHELTDDTETYREVTSDTHAVSE